MVGQITGKMFDHPIEKDCVSDLSDPGSCRIGPVRQVAGPENAAIQNLAAFQALIILKDPGPMKNCNILRISPTAKQRPSLISLKEL